MVFIALGMSQVMMGLVMNRYSEKYCKYKLAIVGTILVELASFASIICYYE
jgi:hypothetical protein